jgi:hypothetical protein
MPTGRQDRATHGRNHELPTVSSENQEPIIKELATSSIGSEMQMQLVPNRLVPQLDRGPAWAVQSSINGLDGPKQESAGAKRRFFDPTGQLGFLGARHGGASLPSPATKLKAQSCRSFFIWRRESRSEAQENIFSLVSLPVSASNKWQALANSP